MAESKRPNIVFVFADDWGWGDLSCYGHQFVKTPNLDRLASQGILFSQFYVCSGVCSPSRAAVMTGRFPAHWGIHGILPVTSRTPYAACQTGWIPMQRPSRVSCNKVAMLLDTLASGTWEVAKKHPIPRLMGLTNPKHSMRSDPPLRFPKADLNLQR